VAGIIATDDGQGFICTVCGDARYSFGRGKAHLIKSHIDKPGHQERVAMTQSGVPVQPAANQALAMLHKAHKEESRYPVSIPFSVHSASEVHDHVQKHRCHGFHHDIVMYNDIEFDATLVKRNCCAPGIL
jgi:hypothetical protein